MKKFKCKTCGTNYSTQGKNPPPSPKWADGHICEMVEVESKLGLFEPTRMDVDNVKSFIEKREEDDFNG